MLKIEVLEEINDFFLRDDLEGMEIICPDGIAVQRVYPKVIGRGVEIKEIKQLAYEDIEATRREDIQLELVALFRQFFPDCPEEYFFRSFNLLMDLRSYSLSLEHMGECLDLMGDQVCKIVRLFWAHLDEKGIIDEHKMYDQQTQMIQDNGMRGRRFSLWGFPHLTGPQVDFVKALSGENDVYIPVFKYQYDHSLDTDWINWMGLEKRAGVEEFKKIKAKTVVFPKKRLAEYIRHFTEGKMEIDIVLARQEQEVYHYHEMAVKGISFETEANIFGSLSLKIFREIKGQSNKGNLEDFLQGQRKKAENKKSFREIKIVLEWETVLKKWKSLTKENKEPSAVELSLFKEIVENKFPNVYSKKIVKSCPVRLFNLGDMDKVDPTHYSLLVASSHYDSLEGENLRYSAEIREILTALGPMRRKGYMALEYKKKIFDFLKGEKAILFIEDGLWEENLFWGEMAGIVEFDRLDFRYVPQKKNNDYLMGRANKRYGEKQFSRKRMQTYVDCPRKFYYTYVEPLPKEVKLSNKLTSAQLGELEHRVIERFFKSKVERREIKKLAESEIDSYLRKEGITLGVVDRIIAENEVRDWATKGVVFVEELKKKYDIHELFLEKKIESGFFRGSADLVASSSSGVIVVDFKSSDTAIPTMGDITGLGDIQIFCYLHHLKIPMERVALMGFFCLSRPEKSRLFSRYLEISLMEKIKCEKIGENHERAFASYGEFEREILEKMEGDRDFLPRPRKEKICDYCSLKQVCPRGALQ